MNDLELLKRLPDSVESLDELTRQRIEALFEAKRDGRVRHRRGVQVAVLGIAAALAIAASAAAAIHWSDQRPVAFQIISPSPGTSMGFQITDPSEPITNAAELRSALLEFAPAIRLPEGGSFEPWEQHVASTLGSNDPAIYQRGDTATGMVHVSQCQWGQRLLDASAEGDQEAANEALGVLTGIAGWWSAEGLADQDAFMGLDQMRNGDSESIQRFEDATCAWTGSWGASPAQQDSKATRDLGPAIHIAAQYLRDGGDASAFDIGSAHRLAPNVFWTSSNEQPAPASPGAIFIALSPHDVVTLVSVSETGTQFCAAVGTISLLRGTTSDDLSVIDKGDGPHAVDPNPVTCVLGGW